MRKRSIAVLLCICLLCLMNVPAAAARCRVTVDGKRVAERGLTTVVAGEVWLPLRELALALGADEVIWDGESRVMTVNAPGLTLVAEAGQAWLDANGVLLYIPGGVRTTLMGTLVPVEALCRAFGAEWSLTRSGSVALESGETPIASWEEFYAEEDLTWLSQLVYAESGTETFECQLSVAEVVVNRLSSNWYPDTIYEVIFDDYCGVQFSPTANGSIYNEPSEACVTAAKLALAGSDIIDDGILFFVSSEIGSNWVSEHCTFELQIGVTMFYS